MRAGRGTNIWTTFYWGPSAPPFENPTNGPTYLGDGADLLDPHGDIRAGKQHPTR